MNNKKVLMLLRAPFPPDVRVMKEAAAIIKDGVEVHLLCYRLKNEEMESDYNGIKIHRYINHKTGSRWLYLATMFWETLTYNSQRWKKNIIKILKVEGINILHVHDLPLGPVAIKVKEKIPDIKVIIDFHENYAAGSQEWFKWSSGFIFKVWAIINNYKRLRKIEEQLCQKCDIVITVVEEMKQRLLETWLIPGEKIFVVSNSEPVDFLAKAKIDKSIVETYQNDFTLLYIGGFGPHRGIDTAISGMKYINEPKIKLLIVGAKPGDPTSERLSDQISSEDLGNRVIMLPWQPLEFVQSYILASSVGIVPHNANDHTNNTIPHKLFQYMMMGKPVIVSSCRSLQRVVSKSDSGLIFEAGNPKDFAEKVELLYSDKKLYNRFASNGKVSATIGEFSYDFDMKTLLKIYNSL